MRTRDFKVFIVRKSNVFGRGTFCKDVTVMEKFIDNYLKKKEIGVSGTGVQKRDFVHIMDVVRLYSQIALSEKARSGIYNVGGNGNVSIRELAVYDRDWETPISFFFK